MKLGIIIALAVLLLAACNGGEQHELVGVWRYDETLLEFRADGTGRGVVEGEEYFDFTWSADDGGLFMRMPHDNFDTLDTRYRAAYEIIMSENGEFFRPLEVLFGGEWSELHERVSGEPGGIVGKWVYECDYLLWYVSYEFRADGTGRQTERQYIEWGSPMLDEWGWDFIWRTDGGYLTMLPFEEETLEYIIYGDRLTISVGAESMEFTREN